MTFRVLKQDIDSTVGLVGKAVGHVPVGQVST